LAAKASHVIKEFSFVFPSDLNELNVLIHRLANNLVVNVSDIHNLLHIVAEVIGQNAADNVEADVGSCMAHMRLIVDCGSTLVPSDLVGVNRLKNVLIRKGKAVAIAYFGVGEGVKHSQFGSYKQKWGQIKQVYNLRVDSI
jgi:hypothetical protein